MRDNMKVLDIAPHRNKRQEFADKFRSEGHDIVSVPGRQEALALLAEQSFDLAVLDAASDLYDTKELVQELREGAQNDPMIAVFVAPRNRPPRQRLTGRTKNVVVLQDGSVDHMTRMVHLAFTIRDKDGDTLDHVEVPLEEEDEALQI
jgi:CheY-like chemotaxis protein